MMRSETGTGKALEELPSALKGRLGDRLMTVEETAAYLGLSPRTIRKYVSEDYIPHIHVSTKTLRFRKSALDSWLEKREHPGRTRRAARPRRNEAT